MIAASIMTTGLFTLGPDDKVEKALAILGKKRVRVVPVVDGDNRLLGVVTSQGLLKSMLPSYIASGLLKDVSFAPDLPDFFKKIKKLSGELVLNHMTDDYYAVAPDAHTMELARVFASAEPAVESILVLDDQKRVLGIIAPWDIFKRICKYEEEDSKGARKRR
jgi:CBS-domain-containing membrane protein